MKLIGRETRTNYCFASKEPGRASCPIECGAAAAGGDGKRRKGRGNEEGKSEGLCG